MGAVQHQPAMPRDVWRALCRLAQQAGECGPGGDIEIPEWVMITLHEHPAHNPLTLMDGQYLNIRDDHPGFLLACYAVSRMLDDED